MKIGQVSKRQSRKWEKTLSKTIALIFPEFLVVFFLDSFFYNVSTEVMHLQVNEKWTSNQKEK